MEIEHNGIVIKTYSFRLALVRADAFFKKFIRYEPLQGILDFRSLLSSDFLIGPLLAVEIRG
ncbi:hypothetical protein BJP51_08490 [Paenibacillus odorifer]|uniref:Uncharacterized protein n=1 Tax=Paenibacillus odorifer TaxID=189426 RepID=A0A1R0WT45_9BACL|nr:hypothetical protein BJP51_08490 [Paenibacillus odorifer]